MDDFTKIFKEGTSGLFDKAKERLGTLNEDLESRAYDREMKRREEEALREAEDIRSALFNINSMGMDPAIGRPEKPVSEDKPADIFKPSVVSEKPSEMKDENKLATSNAPAKTSEAEVETDVEEEIEEIVETMEEVLVDLDKLIGLTEIKENISTLVNLLRIQDQRRAHDLKVDEIGLHQAYLGAPGTGKTTIARIIGRVYKASGRLSKGHLVETDRQGLVGGFVGQTAIKTQEVLESAKGGILFVDEAYSLVPEGNGNDFGQEAITTILKFMEDNRDDFVLIVAGYDNEMDRFLDSNPGLVSRFNEIIKFPDYSDEELFKIFSGIAERSHYTYNKAVAEQIQKDLLWLTENKTKNFANGRTARKYFETLIENQANRLSKNEKNTKKQLQNFAKSDLPKDLQKLA